jgi:hypothetical protein
MGQPWDNGCLMPADSTGLNRQENDGLDPIVALCRGHLNMTMMLAPQKAASG